jgi:hypothetical protein
VHALDEKFGTVATGAWIAIRATPKFSAPRDCENVNVNICCAGTEQPLSQDARFSTNPHTSVCVGLDAYIDSCCADVGRRGACLVEEFTCELPRNRSLLSIVSLICKRARALAACAVIKKKAAWVELRLIVLLALTLPVFYPGHTYSEEGKFTVFPSIKTIDPKGNECE